MTKPYKTPAQAYENAEQPMTEADIRGIDWQMIERWKLDVAAGRMTQERFDRQVASVKESHRLGV
jgi:hypothetical protein